MRAKTMVLTAALLALSGCQEKPAAHTINDSMTQVMEPSAELIWDMMSAAYNERGDGLDPALLSEDAWAKMADASAKMKERAQEMTEAASWTVAASNEPILGSQAVGQPSPPGAAWQAVSAETVQKRIDADPKLFVKKAKALLDSADAMHRASITKDVQLLYARASELDEVCDSCHEPFWGTDEPPPYPH